METIQLEVPEQWSDLIPGIATENLQTISLPLHSSNWTEMVNEIAEKFPSLYERTISNTGGLSDGLAIAINDMIYRPFEIPNKSSLISFNQGDILSIIIPFAGG